jgi:acetyl esterase/lipase
MRYRTLLMLVMVLSCGVVSAQDAKDQPAMFTVLKALSFSEDVPALTLDLYLPKAIENPVPCIIVIQGGGFRPQNGRRFKSFAEHLASHGFAAALISYRGSPDHQYPDTIADVKASVRYIRNVSKTHHIDPSRIGAMGRSAGGTLAALLAVTGEEDDSASQIQAAVCLAGVFDFVSRFTVKQQLDLQPGHKKKIKSNGLWIGPAFSPTSKDWLAASAITHVDPADPPMLFLHARDDNIVPWPQSRDMHRAMLKAGVKSEITIYEKGGHGVNPSDANPLDEMVAFFRKHL